MNFTCSSARRCGRIDCTLVLSQARLAEKMRVQQPTICQLEGGRFTPTLETVEAVAKCSGSASSDFFVPPPPVPNKKLAVA